MQQVGLIYFSFEIIPSFTPLDACAKSLLGAACWVGRWDPRQVVDHQHTQLSGRWAVRARGGLSGTFTEAVTLNLVMTHAV